jgi:predicted Fe-Mo cluster-binding NifX family protein
MRIAIPVTDGQIANHLGMAQTFVIADVENGKVTQQVEVPNPGHGPGGPPPVFIAKCGVNQVLAWGMPPHAQGMFQQMGIKVQLGATGDPTVALNQYLEGTLTYTDENLDCGGKCGH